MYSTKGTADYYTLSGGGEDIGSPFDDTITDGPGTYTVNGGGGSDTFVVPFLSSQVTVTENTAGDVARELARRRHDFATVLDDQLERRNDRGQWQYADAGQRRWLLARLRYFDVTGQPYSSYAQLYDDGAYSGTDYFFTNVTGQPYSSYEYDYSAGNALIGSKFYYTGIAGQPYTGEVCDYDGAGLLTSTTFTGVTGAGLFILRIRLCRRRLFAARSSPSRRSRPARPIRPTRPTTIRRTPSPATTSSSPMSQGQSYTGEEEDFDASGDALARPAHRRSPTRPIRRSSSIIAPGPTRATRPITRSRASPTRARRSTSPPPISWRRSSTPA